jgi:hypothetical protein
MTNFKQEEILNNIIKKLQEKFSEVQLVSVEELGPNSFWISVTEPSDEEKQLELDDLMAELSTDALMDYGFDFQFVPTRLEKVEAQ